MPGKLIFELPTFSIDYGVIENLTIGTNALPLLALSFAQIPVGSFKARYRFFSNSEVSSSLTFYGGGLWIPSSSSNDDKSITFNYFVFTENTFWYLTHSDILNFHMGIWKMSSNTSKDRFSESLSVLAVTPGIGYQKFLSQSFGFETQLLVPIAEPYLRYSHVFADTRYSWAYGLEATLSIL
jgi:hypothetical protein